MFEINVTKIQCLEDTSGPGNDEPYVVVFAADLSGAAPQSGAALYGPFADMNDEEIWGRTKVDVKDEPFWGFDGEPRDIGDPERAIVLVGLLEADHDKAFANSVRTTTQAGLKGQLADYVFSGMEPATIAKRLKDDMEGFLDLAIRSDLERDERLGPVKALSLSQADLDKARDSGLSRTLTFKSKKEESEYKLTLRVTSGVGTTSSPLGVAAKKHRYAAVWEKRPGPAWVAGHGMTSAKYQQEFSRLAKLGYRLIDVGPFGAGAKDYYSALWEKSTAFPSVARHRMAAATYQKEFNRLAKLGYRLTHVSGYTMAGKDRYAAIWTKRPGPAWTARHGMPAAAYQKEFNRLTKLGYRLTHVSGYEVGGKDRYAAIWEKRPGPAWVARHGMSSPAYQKEFNRLAKLGYRLTRLSAYSVGGKARFAAIWEKRSGPAWAARHGMTPPSYQKEFDRLAKKGYRLVRVAGYAVA